MCTPGWVMGAYLCLSSITHSLTHSLRCALPPSLTLTHSLTHSLTQVCAPSLPPSLPPSLTLSLTQVCVMGSALCIEDCSVPAGGFGAILVDLFINGSVASELTQVLQHALPCPPPHLLAPIGSSTCSNCFMCIVLHCAHTSAVNVIIIKSGE